MIHHVFHLASEVNDAIPLTVTRNKKGIDFLVHLARRDCLVLYGEEEASLQLSRATEEMKSKMTPACATALASAGVPYLFSFAATLTRFDFYAVFFRPSLQFHLLASCNLSQVAGRLHVVRLMVNLIRLVSLLEEQMPETTPKLWTTVTFPETGTVITYGPDSVEKVVAAERCLEGRRQLYSYTESSYRSPHVAQVSISRINPNKLIVSPLGVVYPHGPPGELVLRAFLHIARGVKWMQTHGWAHRDISWSDVAYKEPNFFLIDLEKSERYFAADKKAPDKSLKAIQQLAGAYFDEHPSLPAEIRATLSHIHSAPSINALCETLSGRLKETPQPSLPPMFRAT